MPRLRRRTRARLLAALVCLAAVLTGWAVFHYVPFFRPTPPAPAAPPSGETQDRVTAARVLYESEMRALCRQAILPYPPRALFLRAFKREDQLEVWGRGAPERFRLLWTLRITARSGEPGPKRREGDLQVPEGFYAIDLFNPRSNFHLSMRVNYPNASDRILSDPAAPGSDIYLHGGHASIGCLPFGDENISKLYLLCFDTHAANQEEIPIHLFPARPEGPKWSEFVQKEAAERPNLARFWANLKEGYDAFERTRRVPQITVNPDGSYRVTEQR